MDNFTPDMDETLVRLLDGEMNTEEQAALRAKLAADTQLQEQYDRLLGTRAALKHFGLDQQVRSVHQEMMQELKTPVRSVSPVRRIVRLSVAVAAAAILVVGLFVGYQYVTLSPEKVFSANYQPFELSTVRGASETNALEDAYKNKNFAEVIRLHDAGTEQTIKSEFLNAAAALELNDNARAVQSFKKVIEFNNTAQTHLLKDEAEYYLALSYIREKEYTEALRLLEGIQGNPEHLYTGKVSAGLLREVRWLRSK